MQIAGAKEVRPGARARARIGEFLQLALATGSLPYTDHGNINHAEIARQIGLSQSCVWKNRDIVHEFEANASVNYAEDSLARLHIFIQQGLREGSLHYALGKLDRQQAFEAIKVGRKAELARRIELVLLQYDKRAREIGYTMSPGMPAIYIPPGSQRERIFLTVKQCIDDGEPVWRHSRILKSAIAKRMGIDEANLSLHREVFEHFNARYGCREENEAALDRQVEAAIKASIIARIVDVVAGKLEHRAAIQIQLPEAFSTVERRTRMKALFERYDREAIANGYMCVRKENCLQHLTELLASGRFTLALYGTANRAGLRAELGIPSFFKEADDVIALFEAQKIESLRVDPFVAEIDGRYFAFHELCDLGYPSGYVERLTKAFHQSYSELGGEGAGRYHLSLMKLFRWLKEQKGFVATVTESLHDKRTVRDVDWLYVLLQYRDSVDRQSRPRLAMSVTHLTRKLAVHGLVPWLANGIPKGKSREPGRTIKSFAEVVATPADGHESTVEGFMEFVENLTNSDNLSLFAEADRLDSKNFFAALKQDFLINGREGPLEVVAATRTLIEKRQTLLNARFTSLIAEGVQRLEEGEQLASLGADPDSYWDRISDRELSQGERSRIIREFFPNPDTNDRKAFKNILRLIRDKFSRKAPLEREEGHWFFRVPVRGSVNPSPLGDGML